MSAFRALWDQLASIGRDPGTGGYLRYAWSPAELACREWFRAQAAARDMPVEDDGNGNLFAWYGSPGAGAVLTGSHFDSVPHGGAYDGPLGIVSAFLALDSLRRRGADPRRPIGVVAFAEEEGARFGVPCLGSRLLAGVLDPDRAAALADRDGVTLASAMGRPPAGRSDLLDRIGCFVELHIEQGRALEVPVSVGGAIWPHGRWRLDFAGEGNHAGTTRMADRRDPMLTYAYTVLAANKEARLRGAHATVGRVSVEPNTTNAVPTRVRGWLDARAADAAALDALVEAVHKRAVERAARDGTEVTLTEESVSPAVAFDGGLVRRCAELLGAPVLPTGAGHDAGVLSGCAPTAMLFVRNPTGVSHSPAEHATDADCEAGVTALAAVLEDLGEPAVTASYHAEWAWLGEAPAGDVLIETAGGRFTAVTAGVPAPPGATRLTGLTLPGLANAHSHAFHRALRGRTNGRGTFWGWREHMYDVAARLTPDTYRDLARATYAEMALAGVTCVGEFHYLHHDTGGARYADPNEMSAALVEAAAAAGIRITVLDTCYLASTVDGKPLAGTQERFGDGDAARWASRVDAFRPQGARVGAAVHSVRAVPAEQIPAVVDWAAARQAPLHVHLSEQRSENAACRAYHRRTPTELLADAGALGPRTTAVHATHLTDGDRTELGDTDTGVCLCPTTERDLADGIGPARALADAGSPLSLGSDSHAVIDLFEEVRAVELDERLRTERRGHFSAAELLRAATATGHAALGWTDAGAIAAGYRADLVTVRLDSARTAGVGAHAVVFAATAADVVNVVVDGRVVVRDGHHVTIDVPGALRGAIEAVTG